MNVEDQHRRPHLKTELLAIERALEQGKPVLGICLGAQLLAHVLGAPVQRHRPAGDRLVRHADDRRRAQPTPCSAPPASGCPCSSGTPILMTCRRARRISRARRPASSRRFASAATLTASSSISKPTRPSSSAGSRLPSFRAELAAAGLHDRRAGDPRGDGAGSSPPRAAPPTPCSTISSISIGRPNRRRPLPSRGMPSWHE